MSRARAFLGLCAVGVMLALPLSSAQAGAFSIYEQGARAMGRASAFAASPSDPSAMFYNPAGLAMLDGTQIYVGATLIAPSGEFEGSGALAGVTETQASQLFPLPNVYISHRMNDKLVLGLGVTAPFGLGTEWEDPAAFTGRYLATKTDIQALSINPTVAFSVSDQLSIGVGVDFRMMSKLTLNRYSFYDATAFGMGLLDVATAELETDMASAIGYNAGLLFKASDQIMLGASYRAAVDMDYEGTATITQILTGVAPIDGAVAATAGDHDVATSIAYPSVTTFAIAFKATDQLLLEADVNLTGWSSFEKLVVTGLPTGTETIDEDYENSMTIRIGAEYWKDDTMAIRAGFLLDQTPVPNKSISPLLPDAQRTGFSFGIGKTFGSMTIDAAFMYLMFGDADTNDEHVAYNGIYKNSALLFGLNVGYAIGK
ncbi:OmpP1/FadL family transporter [Gemmatimonadota bacterium]